MTRFPANKNYEGKTVTEIGAIIMKQLRKHDAFDKRRADKGGNIAGASMSDSDVINFLKWNYNQCLF